jgi:hypothetical protein
MELCIYTILLILIVYVFLLYSVAYLSYLNPARLNLRYNSYKKKDNNYIDNIIQYENGKENGELNGNNKALKDINSLIQFTTESNNKIPKELYPNPYILNQDNEDNKDKNWKFGYKQQFYRSYLKTYNLEINKLSNEYNIGYEKGYEKGVIKGDEDGKILAKHILNKNHIILENFDIPEINSINTINTINEDRFKEVGIKTGFVDGYLETISNVFLNHVSVNVNSIDDKNYMFGLLNGYINGNNKKIYDNHDDKTQFEEYMDYLVSAGGKKIIKNPSFILIPNYISDSSLESVGYEIGYQIGYESVN